MLYRTGLRNTFAVRLEDARYNLLVGPCAERNNVDGFYQSTFRNRCKSKMFSHAVLDVYKYELYVRITQIIADKFRSHAG